MHESPIARTGPLLRQAAAELMLPRHRQLNEGDVHEKSPGEVVTIVDREVEAWLAPQLAALLPGSRVVGEEACASDATLLDRLDEGDVWLLDPLDGTSNFVAGREHFGIVLALLHEGETVGSSLYLPLRDEWHAAERGAGAWQDGQRVEVRNEGNPQALRGIVKTRFLPPGLKEDVVRRAGALREMQEGTNCTAADYPGIVAGESDFALYWRTLPWDHAGPALYLQEAGGHVARLDGTPYRAAAKGVGLLAGASRGLWETSRGLLGLAGIKAG